MKTISPGCAERMEHQFGPSEQELLKMIGGMNDDIHDRAIELAGDPWPETHLEWRPFYRTAILEKVDEFGSVRLSLII